VFMHPVWIWVLLFHLGAHFCNCEKEGSAIEGIRPAFVAFAQERHQSVEQGSVAAHHTSAFKSSFKRFQFPTSDCKDNDHVRGLSLEMSMRAHQRQEGGVLSPMLSPLVQRQSSSDRAQFQKHGSELRAASVRSRLGVLTVARTWIRLTVASLAATIQSTPSPTAQWKEAETESWQGEAQRPKPSS